MSVSLEVAVPTENIAGMANLPRRCLDAGGTAAYNFVREYHENMDWRGPRWFPGPNSGEFAQSVVDGWQVPQVTAGEAQLRNTFGLLAWKVTGGTIVPTQMQRLAIPLISPARGVWPRNWTGEKLFRVGDALLAKIGGQLQAVYALAQAVTQEPWPGAMPPDEELVEAFNRGVQEFMAWLEANPAPLAA